MTDEFLPRISGYDDSAYYATEGIVAEPAPPEEVTMPVDPVDGTNQPNELLGPLGIWKFPIARMIIDRQPQPEAEGLGVSSTAASAGHMSTGIASDAAHSAQVPRRPRDQMHVF